MRMVLKDEDFIAAPGTIDVIKRRIRQVFFDEQGRRCTRYELPADITDEEKAAVAEMDRVTANLVKRSRENPPDQESMEWAESEAHRLNLKT